MWFDWDSMIQEFSAGEIIIKRETDTETVGLDGERIDYPVEEIVIPVGSGCVVPMGANTLNRSDNGDYTAKDRKLVCYMDLKQGDTFTYKDKLYTIDRAAEYQDYTNARIYYCKGWDK